jgi:hypothetical protein
MAWFVDASRFITCDAGNIMPSFATRISGFLHGSPPMPRHGGLQRAIENDAGLRCTRTTPRAFSIHAGNG